MVAPLFSNSFVTDFKSAMLTVATPFKLLAEIALLALLGQWMVGVILARWPSTANGYAAEGYFYAMGVLWLVQAAGLAWLWGGRRLLEVRRES